MMRRLYTSLKDFATGVAGVFHCAVGAWRSEVMKQNRPWRGMPDWLIDAVLSSEAVDEGTRKVQGELRAERAHREKKGA